MSLSNQKEEEDLLENLYIKGCGSLPSPVLRGEKQKNAWGILCVSN